MFPTNLPADGSGTDGTSFGHVLGGHLRCDVAEAAVSPRLSPDPFLFGDLPSPVVGNGEPDSTPPVKGSTTMLKWFFLTCLREPSAQRNQLVGVNFLGQDSETVGNIVNILIHY